MMGLWDVCERDSQMGLLHGHFLDYVFLCAVFIGYSFLLQQENLRGLFILLTIFTAFMMNSYLSFAATNEFKITFLVWSHRNQNPIYPGEHLSDFLWLWIDCRHTVRHSGCPYRPWYRRLPNAAIHLEH